jgi:hypothetical protein
VVPFGRAGVGDAVQDIARFGFANGGFAVWKGEADPEAVRR